MALKQVARRARSSFADARQDLFLVREDAFLIRNYLIKLRLI